MELLSKIKYYIILITIFLVPIIFNPYSSDIFNSIKGLLILFSSGLILFLWGIEAYMSKKFQVKLSWVNVPILVIFGIYLLNLVASTPIISSLFGQGGLTGISSTIFGTYGTLGMGFLTVTALCIFYFASSSSINSTFKKEQVMRILSLSGAVTVIFSLIRYILPSVDLKDNYLNIIFKGYGVVNPSFPTIYPSQNFSPIGEYFLMPIFSLICIVLTLYLLNNNLDKRGKAGIFKIVDFAVLVILVVGFVVTSAMTMFSYENFSIFPYVFYILGALVLLFTLYKNLKNLGVVRVAKNKVFMPYILVVVASVLSVVYLLISKITQIASPLSPLSVSWSSTFAALGSSLKNGFLGIGAENFSVTYLQNRPVGINNTNLIFETINRGGNFILEVISNFGLLGLGAFLFIIVKVILYFIKSNKDHSDKYITTLGLVFFIILVSLFLLPLNLTMLFVIFVMFILLSAVSTEENVNMKNVIIAFRSSNAGGAVFSARNLGERASDKNVAHILFTALATILFLASAIFSYSLFSAQYNYAKSFRHTNISDANDETDLNAAIDDTAKSIQSFGYADNFYNRYAALVFQKLSNSISRANTRIDADNKANNPTNDPNKNATLTTAEQNEIQTYLTSLSATLDKAIQTNPLNYENYYLASRVYFELAKTNQSQYLQKASDYINLALRLNPQNPTLYILAANIYALNNDASNASNALITSINKFPTLDAFAQLAQLYRNLKQYDSAIQTLQSAQQFVQKDSDTYKQIDDAIKTLNDEKAKDPDANKPIQATPTTVTGTATPTPTVTAKPTTTPTVTPKK